LVYFFYASGESFLQKNALYQVWKTSSIPSTFDIPEPKKAQIVCVEKERKKQEKKRSRTNMKSKKREAKEKRNEKRKQSKEE